MIGITPEEELELGELERALEEDFRWHIETVRFLELNGWIKVSLNHDPEDQSMIREWCEEHSQGMVNGRGRVWMFEKDSDASLFVLRWT